MTEAHVGVSNSESITVELDGVRAGELRRWAAIGRRSVEETVLAAIDEYITPVETEAHGRHPLVDRQSGVDT